jgi:cytochrome P450
LIAAEETRGQGLFRQTFLNFLLPFARQFVIVHDVDLVRKILSKESWGVYKKGEPYKIAGDLIGTRALLSSPDNEHWQWQRKIMTPGFSRENLEKMLIPSVHKAVDAMCSRWEAQAAAKQGQRPVVEFRDDAYQLTLEILGMFAFGFDFGSDNGKNDTIPLHRAFVTVLEKINEFTRNPLRLLTRKLPFPSNTSYWAGLNAIETAAKAAIDKRIRDGNNCGRDLLDLILHAAKSDGKKLDSSLIVENLQTLLFAGHDTTASALSWAVYLLATHPDEEKKLVEEFRSLESTNPDFQELSSLPFLDAVVKETLRLYPGAGFVREPLTDVQLGNYDIPKGTDIIVFPYIIHRNEKLFHRPYQFDPSRWLSAQARASAPESMGWLPFSLGLRNCIGAQVAKLELKVALHLLFTRYRFEAADDLHGPPRVALYMTLVPNYMPLIPHLR